MKPTHVLCLAPRDCSLCKGTGLRPPGHLSFERIIGKKGEDVCPECGGAKSKQVALTLAEFAALFTWSTYHSVDDEGRNCVQHVIRPMANESEGRDG